MTMDTAVEVTCPKCGGRVWDNRESKKNPAAPDYKCRDRSCDGVIWPPRKPKASPAASHTQKAPHSIGDVPWDEAETGAPPAPAQPKPSPLTPIVNKYAACLKAARIVAESEGITELNGDVAGAVCRIATHFSMSLGEK